MQRVDRMNIVFVCTGNTCRSPMAEGLFRKKTKAFADYCHISSCGLSAMPGDTASENAVLVLQKNGIDISSHRSRQINNYIIDEADRIICLAKSHYDALFPIAGKKLILMGNGIPDPYMGNEKVYTICADSIENEIDNLLASDVFLSVEKTDMTDLSAIAEIENTCFSDPWSLDAFKDELEKPYGISFVVRMLGKPVGYVFADDICDTVTISNIAVDAAMRRRNIGDRLMTKMTEYCRNRHSDSLTLEVRISNTAAINLYNKHGFELLGKRKNFYSKPTEDAYIMTKYFNGDTI